MVKRVTKSNKPVFIAVTVILVLILVSLFFINSLLEAHNNSSSNILSASSANSSNVQQSSTPVTSSAKENDIQKVMNQMTIDEKLGQMIIGGYDDINEILPIIREDKLGGIILYKNNISSVSQVKKDIFSLKESNSKNKIPIIISTDQEGGRVSRLPAVMGTFESALSIGDRNNSAYAYNSGVKIAKALKQLGFNLDFAPDMDIYSNPENTVIADRAFGRTPDRVSKIAIQVLKGLQSEKIIPTVKHFPGHGDTAVDSHIGLPVVDKSVAQLTGFEFKPFIAAIKNNADMMMIAHIELRKVDTVPSTLSYKIVTGILRNQLGFKGVIITDDMTMGAIAQNYTLANASVIAVSAGCDIVLVAKGAQNSVIVLNALKTAYQNGQITEKRIDESVYRILSMKKKYGLTDQA
jgi:beta-N-acetylhexosaminidase